MSVSALTNEILTKVKDGGETRDPTPIACYNCYLRNVFLSKFTVNGKGRIFISVNSSRSVTGQITIDGTLVIPSLSFSNTSMPICYEFTKSVVGIPYDDSYAAYVGIILYWGD